MAYKIGYLDANGYPCIKVSIWGLNRQFAQEFDAAIDTGFTGFLSIPIASALPLALTLYGTGTYQLADGSQSTRMLGCGAVAVGPGQADEETAHGIIVLEPNGAGLLLGMDFLRKLNKVLMVGSTLGVWLIDPPTAVGAKSPPSAESSSASSAAGKSSKPEAASASPEASG
jgi:predicted aspartyl protease